MAAASVCDTARCSYRPALQPWACRNVDLILDMHFLMSLIACLYFQLPDRACEHGILCTQQRVGQDLNDPWERCSCKAADDKTHFTHWSSRFLLLLSNNLIISTRGIWYFFQFSWLPGKVILQDHFVIEALKSEANEFSSALGFAPDHLCHVRQVI